MEIFEFEGFVCVCVFVFVFVFFLNFKQKIVWKVKTKYFEFEHWQNNLNLNNECSLVQ